MVKRFLVDLVKRRIIKKWASGGLLDGVGLVVGLMDLLTERSSFWFKIHALKMSYELQRKAEFLNILVVTLF